MSAFDDTTRPRRRRAPQMKSLCVATVVYSPDASAVGRTLDFDDGECLVGRRGSGSGLISDGSLSRGHVKWTQDGRDLRIEDLGTSNGTFVNGRRVYGGPHKVRAGEVVSTGDTLTVVDDTPSADHLPVAAEVEAPEIDSLVGDSLAARRLRMSLATVASTLDPVLLLGPTGAGKEVAAAAIAELSGENGPFVAVNCAAIPKELAESEMFGHAAGAFTGAATDKKGYFQQAAGGTLFLDEVGDLPESLQSKLLRVLETGEVRPVGSESSSIVRVRIVAATHKPIETSSFRKDLFARLSDWVLRLPSLAARRVDVLPLFMHFLNRSGAVELTPEMAEALVLHSWPMNIRELAKLARRVTRLAPSDAVLDIDTLPASFHKPIAYRFEGEDDGSSGGPTKQEVIAVLQSNSGNVQKTASALGWHRTQLYRWLRREGVEATSFRPASARDRSED